MGVLVGSHTIDRLGDVARGLTSGTVLVVTDEGVERAGIADRARDSLQRAGLSHLSFSGVSENPTTAHVAAGAARARESAGGVDLIVGLGGGSAMDCAKGINFLLSNGGRMEDFWGDGKARKPMLPSIGIPTTAGTGSEAQRFALIAQEETNQKMACGDEKARFRSVILDGELLASVPAEVAAASGIDAVSHAVESYVCTAASPASRLLARQALRSLSASLEAQLRGDASSRDRQRLLMGAHWAGAAIERSMLGAAHACANPLTARYHIVHGVAVGVMLPHVIAFNNEVVNGEYDALMQAVAGGNPSLANWISELNGYAGLPRRLRELEVDKADLPALAAEAATQKTASFNPRPVDANDLQALYEAAY